jgi:hypothetical protein
MRHAPAAALAARALLLAQLHAGGATSSTTPTDAASPAAASLSCLFAPHDFDAAITMGSISAGTSQQCCAGCQKRPGCEASSVELYQY